MAEQIKKGDLVMVVKNLGPHQVANGFIGYVAEVETGPAAFYLETLHCTIHNGYTLRGLLWPGRLDVKPIFIAEELKKLNPPPLNGKLTSTTVKHKEVRGRITWTLPEKDIV